MHIRITHDWRKEFHGKAESDLCYLLDNLGLKWLYRPKSFMLKNGEQHAPDLYLPEIRLWIDIMDRADKISIPKVKGFSAYVKEGRIDSGMRLYEKRKKEEIGRDNAEYLLIGPDGAAIIEYPLRAWRRFPTKEQSFVSEATLTRCPGCGKWYFVGHTGETACRHCWIDDYLRVSQECAMNISKGGLLVDSRPVVEWVETALIGRAVA